MGTSGLIIRRNERHEISLPAKVRVAFSHTELVKLSKGTAGEKGWIEVHLIDFSENGLGIVTEVFFPRGSVLEVCVSAPEDGEGSEVLLNCEIRVMRVQMTDRRPAYLIGGAFAELKSETKGQIERLMGRLGGYEPGTEAG
jgi:hypothetical protein